MTTPRLPVLLLLVAALAGCTSTPSPTPTTTARAVTCPEALDRGQPPTPLAGFDAGSGLVPTQAPTSAVLCDFSGKADGTPVPLITSDAITAGLPRLASDLLLAHGSPSGHSCPAPLPDHAADTTLLLLGYPKGTLTLTLEERCEMSLTNGSYRAQGWQSIRTEITDHRWTGMSSVDAGCEGDWTRRLTAGQRLPSDPVSIRVCGPAGRGALLDDQGRRDVLSALEKATLIDPASFDPCPPDTLTVNDPAVVQAIEAQL